MSGALLLFALNASAALGGRVAEALGMPLAPHEEREFEDGEHKGRPLESVRGADAYVLQSLHGVGGQSANDKLVRLLLFIGALKQSGAERVTVLAPYLCYSRKDRRTKPNDPVSTRYIAQMFEAVGTDRILTLDVHNLAAYQNAFRCITEHLEARHIMAEPVAAAVGDSDVLVLSPDTGGAKRADRFREVFEARLGRPVAGGFVEKRRSAGQVSGQLLCGEVSGRTVVIVDDLIAGGTTMVRAANACRQAGAERVMAVASHGLFSRGASGKLAASELERIFLTDSVPLVDTEAVRARSLQVVGIGPLLATAIRRLHEDKSLVELSEAYGY
jgi:ribose-phosphate pyrophosphokinase